MDIIETINAIFEDILPKILECSNDTSELKKLLSSVKRSVLCAAVCNPMNTTYIIDTTTPIEYSWSIPPL